MLYMILLISQTNNMQRTYTFKLLNSMEEFIR